MSKYSGFEWIVSTIFTGEKVSSSFWFEHWFHWVSKNSWREWIVSAVVAGKEIIRFLNFHWMSENSCRKWICSMVLIFKEIVCVGWTSIFEKVTFKWILAVIVVIEKMSWIIQILLLSQSHWFSNSPICRWLGIYNTNWVEMSNVKV